MNHLDELTINAIADGEQTDDHVRQCAQCAAAVLDVMQMKRAVRALPRFDVGRVLNPSAARRAASVVAADGLRPRPTFWLAAAAVIVLALLLIPYLAGRATARDLVDLHTTILASAAPVDVISTDRHTVKPWFEGKVPFAVDVPELAGTPFRLAGGRVVFLHGQPCAYLLIEKGAHRVSLFVFDAAVAPRVGNIASMTIETWRARGLVYVAVADLPRADLDALRHRF
jgi:anti-sigma factor RsiW